MQARLSNGEFIALIAVLFATIAISIDAMLPALPEIAASLSPDAPNRAQLVITSFVFGMGLGTLFAGPMSDAFGRKPVIIGGAVLYAIGAMACWMANSLEILLIARVVQGLGSAGPRAVSIAMVRDLFSGREMARIMSFAMMIFTLVPAVAPMMGQGIVALAGWHTIFLTYVVFAAFSSGWLALRQPETLPPASRRPLALDALTRGVAEVFSHRIVVISVLCQTLTLAMLFSTLSSMQGIFDQRFGQGDNFPYWFAGIALTSMTGSFVNSRIVMRVGMRAVVVATYGYVVALTAVILALIVAGIMPETMAFPAHLLWSVGLFAMMGLTMGNLNALAMEPVGHIAGLASSVISALATVAAVLLAIPVGQMLNGTQVPLMTAVLIFATLALGLMRLARR
ncbi:multidrug effflux MFS transporter [Fuscibacter oryzae]|uniref:Multidrug effflux MFS transporter n=1 Tax=Fuscibacter oryzae TaxID=2803939 RepID=A0A8J7MSA1_9RHOB|nr:multidrug effflux MFS transporter [Fuscibacter oryzae]MBL4927488.1 multidrug effflux MFS transporter [Fuscibacter oryzae]